MHGYEICVGDLLAVAFPIGSSAEMRMGTVKKFGTRKNSWSDEPEPIMHMVWDQELSSWAPDKSTIKRSPNRIIIMACSEEFPFEDRRKFER